MRVFLCFRKRSAARRGISTLWLILALPVAVIGLAIGVEAGQLWLARAELQNSLEAAALAAAKTWGDQIAGGGGSDTAASRGAAVNFALANRVGGQAFNLPNNYTAPTPANPNGNQNASTGLRFGRLVDGTPSTFDPNADPAFTAANERGVTITASFTVNGVTQNLFGSSPGSTTLQATASAAYVPGGSARLVSFP